MLSGAGGLEERRVLAGIHIRNFVFRCYLNKFSVLHGVKGKAPAVIHPYSRRVAEEVDEHFVLFYVLRPCAVEGYACLVGADVTGDEIFNVVHTVKVLCLLSPHPAVDI